MVYSYEEQVVGNWLDGKPLYQKTFFTTTPNTTGGALTDIDLSALDVKEIVNCFGYVLSNNNNKYFINQYCYVGSVSSSSGIFRRIGENVDELAMCADTNIRNKDMYLTIQYTKLSD